VNSASRSATDTTLPSSDSIAAVDSAITTRRSMRRFLPTPVPRATVEEILAVASRAPSGTNTQPWQVHAVAGATREALSRAIIEAGRNQPGEHHEEYHYYPVKWTEPYLGRRRKLGWDLYALLGITKGDHVRMKAHFERNYLFFDAPVGLIFTIDRVLERGSWLDYGMFLQNVMVAARARGLDTCPQAAFCRFHKVIAAELHLPADQQVVCGMALGYADPDAPENALRSEREPVASFTRFAGFE
jgi:nitroreductase